MLIRPVLLEVFDGLVQRGFVFLVQVLGALDAVNQLSVLVLAVGAQRTLGRQCLASIDIVELAVVDRKQRERHFPNLQGLVLRLFHQFGHQTPALQLLSGGFVQIGGKLGKSGQLAVLRQ